LYLSKKIDEKFIKKIKKSRKTNYLHEFSWVPPASKEENNAENNGEVEENKELCLILIKFEIRFLYDFIRRR